MALAIYFKPDAFTPAAYDKVIKQLEAKGAGSPSGRRYHVAFESNGLIQVFDIWDSEESFKAFGEILMPIMTAHGVNVAPEKIVLAEVHNIVEG